MLLNRFKFGGSILSVATVASLSILSTSCMDGTSTYSKSLSVENQSAGAGPVGMSAIAQQQVNLGSSVTVPVTVQAQNGFSGPVELSIDTSLLSVLDPMATVTASIDNPSVILGSGQSTTVNVTINVSASAPDFTNVIHLVSNAGGISTTTNVPIQVMPVLEVDILDSGTVDTNGKENWSIPAGAITKLTSHLNGVTVIFKNKDTVENSGFYRIHSNGVAYAHQGGQGLGTPGSTTPVNADGTDGDSYKVVVMSQSPLTETSYDHNNENGGTAGRKFMFNAYSAPVPAGQSGNPNASFTYIKNNLITVSCATCHVNNLSAGSNINLATYTDVTTSGYVTPGDAANSAFYTQIAPNGGMPQGNPGSTSAALVQDVKDWINDGAKNN